MLTAALLIGSLQLSSALNCERVEFPGDDSTLVCGHTLKPIQRHPISFSNNRYFQPKNAILAHSQTTALSTHRHPSITNAWVAKCIILSTMPQFVLSNQ